ncbi:MAG: preprotein translocase subunit SecE [Candidatus Firestonebacteria bacterium]
MFKKLKDFLNEVKIEMLKVSWPTKDETIGSTVVVIITVAILSVFTGVADVIISGILQKIIVGG